MKARPPGLPRPGTAPPPPPGRPRPRPLPPHVAVGGGVAPQPPIAPPLRDWPPELISSLEVEGEPVARGSFGEVFRGIDRATGATVAVKVLAKARPAGGKSVLDTAAVLHRLRREVDLMGSVAACGNVVQLRSVVEGARHAYVVLDYVDGGDLEAWLGARDAELDRERAQGGGGGGGTARPPAAWPPPPATATEAEAALLIFELLKVITACHAAGVVHGDVKPANILLRGAAADAALAAARGEGMGRSGGQVQPPSPDGRPFLALSDFGLARPASPAGTTGTRGTPVFMAPEVFRGGYGPPADVWAAGVTAFFLLTRRYPWWGTLAEVFQLTPRAVRATVLNPATATFNPADPALAALSPACRDFLGACLARDPAGRPSAVAALAHPWFAAALPPDRALGDTGRAIAAAAAAAAAATFPPPPIDGEEEAEEGEEAGEEGGTHLTTPHPDAAALAAFVGVLAHKTMATCEACAFERCPLSGAAARALDRVELAEEG